MKVQKTEISKINQIVNNFHFVKDRKEALEQAGYIVERVPMGSGGKGQVKELVSETRIQIGYGVTRHNYAYAVIIKK